jgi:hypothetical protein
MKVRAQVMAVVAAAMVVPASASATAPTAGQKTAFPVLRGAPTVRVPEAVQRFIASAHGRQAGVDAAHVERIAGPDGGRWSVLPGDGQVCVVFEDHEGIAACAPDAQAAVEGVRVKLITPSPVPGSSAVIGPTVDVGLAPASVARVTSTQGASRPTKAGAYAVRATQSSPVSLFAFNGERINRGSLDVASRAVRPVARAAALRVWDFCQHATGQGYWCTISGSLWSAVEPFTSSIVQSADGHWICGNMVNGDGSWAGTTFCSTDLGGASHPWNATNRTAWTGPGVAGDYVGGGSAAYWND